MTKTSTPLKGEERQAGAVETAPARLEGGEGASAVPSPSTPPVGAVGAGEPSEGRAVASVPVRGAGQSVRAKTALASPPSPWGLPQGAEQAQRELEAEREKEKALRERLWRDMHTITQEHTALLGSLVVQYGQEEGVRRFQIAHLEQPDLLEEARALHNGFDCLTPNALLKFKLEHLDNMSNPRIVRAAFARIGATKVSNEVVSRIVADIRAARRAIN